MDNESVARVLDSYQETLGKKARSTASAYRSATRRFARFLTSKGYNLAETKLSEASVDWLLEFLKLEEGNRPGTRQVTVAALSGFYKFLNDQGSTTFDLGLLSDYRAEMRSELQHQGRRGAADFEVSRIIEMVLATGMSVGTRLQRLRLLRDKAIILTLAGCDLRVQDLCDLCRDDVDYRGKLLHTKNGTKSISQRALGAIRQYVSGCSFLDSNAGRKLNELPLFLRHDRRAGTRLQRLTRQTVTQVLNEWADQAVGRESRGKVTALEFRKYYENSCGLTRSLDFLHPEIVQLCQRLFEMQEYDVAIFTAMRRVEETIRAKAHLGLDDIGVEVAKKAFNPEQPLLKIGHLPAEQASARFLYWGALGLLKNPRSHRSLNLQDPITAYECLAFASLLLRMLDDVG